MQPPPSRWDLPAPETADAHGLVGVGADLEPGTLLDAYRAGLFPMRVSRAGPLGWWSPDPRGIVPLERLHVSRSLRRSCRRFRTSVDSQFRAVVAGCADPRRPHGWIDESFADAYTTLHRLGFAHSVEVWSAGGDLVGGVYGVAIGGLFAGESMFHRETDASKVALVELVARLRSGGGCLFDVQWTTPHLVSLGAVDVDRPRYLELLADAVRRPQLRLS
jgi:leucyl/phenylalanyl-tRNA--protein transferase